MDLRALQRLQRGTGFNVDFIEKAYHITNMLFEIYEDEKLGRNLALKGGTALNFIYLDIPRLSIDLDLNFIGALEKEKMLKARPRIAEGIVGVADRLGYRVTKKPPSYIMERFLIRYKTLKGVQDSIKVEINYLERVPFMGRAKRGFRHFFEDVPEFEVNTYIVEEICAMKSKAMAERLYARDLFDMYNLSKLKLQKEILRKLMILYMLIAGKKPEIEGLVSKIKRYDDGEVVRKIGQFTTQSQVLDAALIKRGVVEFYEDVFKLDDSDQKFLELIGRGVIDLDVLFGGIKYNKKAQKHPSLYHALFRSK